MSETWVVNASPLILLARVGQLGLLTSLAKRVLVPAAVLDEVAAGNHLDGSADAVKKLEGLTMVANRVVPASILAWDLGAGESQVLAHTLEEVGAAAVLDDLAARRCAKAFGFTLVGTLGVVALARKRGMLDEARPVFDAFQDQGMRIAPRLLRELLELLGE